MKILALRLANLASLPGPLELDFTAPPLAEAGLFAITGPTGAGKSTLLDALCLALYGNTPRLRLAPSRDSQIDDTPDSRLTTSDPRTLLRRGTASGHAEVDFLGRDGCRYRARWAVRRAREKATGRLQAVEQSLTDLDADRLLTTQKREFDRLLPERLGLTFDQFTRAVLLAQSEFAAFLKADDNERSDLLERLTGTAEYSAISMAAYRRASEAKKAVDALEARLADDLPAEPEARAELERTAEATQRALTHLQRQAESLQARQRWHETDTRLAEGYRQGLTRQHEAEAAWQALDSLRADRDWRRRITPRRHALARQAALPGEIAALEATHAETRRALAGAEEEVRDATAAHGRAGSVLEAASEARRRAEPALNEARAQHHALTQRRRELAELEAQWAGARKQAERLHEAHRHAQAAQQKRLTQQQQWLAALAELVGEHSHHHAARQAIQAAHDEAAARHLALGELQAAWREAHQAEQAHHTLETRLAEADERLATLTRDGQAARRHLEQCQAHRDGLESFIAQARAARSESVATLREGLREGEPCPVCGGLDHPWRLAPPATPEAAQLAAQQAEEEQALTAARQAQEQALNAHQELQAQYKIARDTRQQLQAEQPASRARWEAARQALAAHPLHRELAALPADERESWLIRQRQRSLEERSAYQARLERLQRAEAELAPLQASLHEGELALTRLESDKSRADRDLAALEARLPELQRQCEDTERTLRSLLGDHATPEAWQQRLDQAEAEARRALDAALSHRHAAEQAQQRLAQQAAHEARQLMALTEEQKTLDAELSAWRQRHPGLDDATLVRLLAQPDDEAQEEERQIEAADQARQHAAATLAERRQALLQHRRDQGLTAAATGNAQEAEPAAVPEDEPRDEEALLAEATEAEIRRRQEALAEERRALAPQLEEAQRARDAAALALADDERKRERQRAGQAELEAARTEYRRWGQISELIGSADGKLFRRIAQAYNLEQLLEHANAHLAGLSRRYRLVRGGSPLGLLVVDQDMGDETRSVHSLSGGETFLVSLALALGLASMASGELTIESLFIDEGFGSLDPQSLELAMDALDGLQALGRRVGVISHVQEMHERIPVQIQVEPQGNGTSRARLASL